MTENVKTERELVETQYQNVVSKVLSKNTLNSAFAFLHEAVFDNAATTPLIIEAFLSRDMDRLYGPIAELVGSVTFKEQNDYPFFPVPRSEEDIHDASLLFISQFIEIMEEQVQLFHWRLNSEKHQARRNESVKATVADGSLAVSIKDYAESGMPLPDAAPVEDQTRSIAFLGKMRPQKFGASKASLMETGFRKALPLLKGKEREQAISDLRDYMAETFETKLDECYEGGRQVTLLKAPTGSGKTTTLVQQIVCDPKTYHDVTVTLADGSQVTRRAPFIFMAPNHDLLSEVETKMRILCLDRNLPDEELMRAMIACGYVKDMDQAAEKVDEVRADIIRCNRDPALPELKIGVLKSRARGGCKKTKELEARSRAGLGAESLCHAKVRDRDTGEMKDVYCEHYDDCPFIRERKLLEEAHVILAPHAYLTIENIPEAAKNPRMVIIDEQISDVVLKHEFLPIESLMVYRRRTTDFHIHEIEVGSPGYDYIMGSRLEKSREFREKEACRIWGVNELMRIHETGDDPAQHFLKMERKYKDGELEMIRVLPNTYDKYDNFEFETQEVKEIVFSNNADPVEGGLGSFEQKTVITGFRDDLEKTYNFRLPSPVNCVRKALECMRELCKHDPRLSPNTDASLLDAISKDTSRHTLRPERKMWELINDSIDRLVHDILNCDQQKKARAKAELARMMHALNNGLTYNPEKSVELVSEVERQYHGSRDHRFQFVGRDSELNGAGTPQIRFSWRESVNWQDKPVLLMDASANEDVVRKIFNDRNVLVRDAVGDFGRLLNVRTVAVVDNVWSTNALRSQAGSTLAHKFSTGISLAAQRDMLSVICANHAQDRVLVGTNKSIRGVIGKGWMRPPNMDECHYGNIRGIDVWKHHGAAVSIGRQDLPISVIDAIAASLTWDDREPEKPFDIHGNGCSDAAGTKPLFQPREKRILRVRDGRFLTVDVGMVPGKWGRIVQNQSREEELLQFIGRMRPVYRSEDTVPTYYAVSSVIPAGMVIDDCVSIRDIIGDDFTNMLPGDKSDMNPTPKIRREREYKNALTRIMAVATGHHIGILCPEYLASDYGNLHIPFHDRDEFSLLSVLSGRGFNLSGERSVEQGMADGWSLYSYSIMGSDYRPIWLMSSVYRTRNECLDAINRYLVMNLNARSEDICIAPVHEAVPGMAVGSETLDEMMARRDAYDAENGYLENDVMKYMLDNQVLVSNQGYQDMLVSRSCEGPDVPSELAMNRYFLTDTTRKLFSPVEHGHRNSAWKAGKEELLMARIREFGLQHHQIRSVLTILMETGPHGYFEAQKTAIREGKWLLPKEKKVPMFSMTIASNVTATDEYQIVDAIEGSMDAMIGYMKEDQDAA